MPPTRGHDLKQKSIKDYAFRIKDAPHTGARLETRSQDLRLEGRQWMPPTRGHDLKHRLPDNAWDRVEMPPTRGHDLKRDSRLQHSPGPCRMPPTRGHDLKRIMC